jgi:hypothetical protein
MSLASEKKNDRASTKRGEGAKASDMKCKCGRLLYRRRMLLNFQKELAAKAAAAAEGGRSLSSTNFFSGVCGFKI